MIKRRGEKISFSLEQASPRRQTSTNDNKKEHDDTNAVLMSSPLHEVCQQEEYPHQFTSWEETADDANTVTMSSLSQVCQDYYYKWETTDPVITVPPTSSPSIPPVKALVRRGRTEKP